MSEKKATIQDAINARVCYSQERLQEVFGKRKTLTAKQIAKLNISHKNKVWALTRDFFLSKNQCVIFAIFCAEQSIEIFENKYPNDDRPRKAIDAAKNWLKVKNSAAASAAAYAASAAYVSASASAAAYAAYAAYASASASASASAAADDAYADAYAYAAAYADASAAAAAARAKFEKAQIKKLLEIIYAGET